MLRRLAVLILSLTAFFSWSASWAQAYPNRPVRLIVGFGVGTPDTVARIIGQPLAAQMGQSFVVENRPGANGIIGADIVAKATPDGHTLLVTSQSFAVNPSIYRKLPYDTIKDFFPVTNICSGEGHVLVVNPAVPAHTAQELIALARKPDSRLAYGSPGTGNALHLVTALFNARAGTKMVHVPYKGAGPAIMALLAGETQVMFVTPSSALPQIKAGKLRPLGYNNRTRAAFLPDVPTMAEAGVSGMEMNASWYGLFAPANTPREIVARLHSEIQTALRNPQVQERFRTVTLEPDGSTPAAFKAFLENAIKRSAEVVALAGIEPE